MAAGAGGGALCFGEAGRRRAAAGCCGRQQRMPAEAAWTHCFACLLCEVHSLRAASHPLSVPLGITSPPPVVGPAGAEQHLGVCGGVQPHAVGAGPGAERPRVGGLLPAAEPAGAGAVVRFACRYGEHGMGGMVGPPVTGLAAAASWKMAAGCMPLAAGGEGCAWSSSPPPAHQCNWKPCASPTTTLQPRWSRRASPSCSLWAACLCGSTSSGCCAHHGSGRRCSRACPRRASLLKTLLPGLFARDSRLPVAMPDLAAAKRGA